jgi:hypothetical protein
VSDLYPTKTRRDLLGAVDRGQVYLTEKGQIMRRGDDYFPRTCTAAMRELVPAGWVRLGPGSVYELTDTGRAVLDGGAR